MEGGLLQRVQWGVPRPRVRGELHGRQSFDWAELSVYIRDRVGLDRDRFRTDRADDIRVVVFDEVSIDTDHVLRWGNPVTTYRIVSIAGFIADEATGARYASEIVVIR